MEIMVIGNESNLKECQSKFGASHTYERADFARVEILKPGMIVFDFDPKDVSVYNRIGLVIFLNTTLTTLARMTDGKSEQTTLFGFCGLPSFLNREILEVSTITGKADSKLETICLQLGTKYKIVDDRVGMITPRIICMIINEAYFAIEESVASRADIDLAMKLGTNYPFGPFEWADKIGIRNVYELLKAVYNSTKDDRYQICTLLEAEASSFHAKPQSS